ncbi:S-methyl-5-thioribose-1-phosphate isomerase [Alicyclobacillus tolerans]|uniref:S-methyl-5-thioribose-1-phosphate isomerase n=1 Tax=Alicyclobacillus tolerans TaxID=90970 RepID=UPI003B7EFC03
MSLRAIEWDEHKETLKLLDQRVLPHQSNWIECLNEEDVAAAIAAMVVRGAPAIGLTAAYGILLAAIQAVKNHEALWPRLKRAEKMLIAARPTAVHLQFTLEEMLKGAEQLEDRDKTISYLLSKVRKIEQEDSLSNRNIGAHGANWLQKRRGKQPLVLLTHCNTGALATADFGTALGIIRTLQERGSISNVFVDETRPYLQGARLTAYELEAENIPYTLITDSMAAAAMRLKKVDAVIVGADRIASNGDTANKIGTYSLAVLAKAHQIPFCVAAPLATFDWSLPSGEKIPIEERPAEEMVIWNKTPIAPQNARVWNPAFDVTPFEWISAIFTEEGVIESIADLERLHQRNTPSITM